MNARRFMCGWPPPGKRKCNVPPIILCLLLGWSGVIAYDSLASAIPSSSLWLLAIGGILYSLGALFHVWQRLRFHNAIWHGFVLLAASCHYSAVLACMPWE
jgi:hemolysin III